MGSFLVTVPRLKPRPITSLKAVEGIPVLETIMSPVIDRGAS
jgi:hypothetical protein